MCARNLFSCEKQSRAVSKTDGHLKKNNAKCPSNSGRGESSTRPSVEFYRGEIGVKMPFTPQKRAGFAPKITPTSSGDLVANSGRVIVSEHTVTPNVVPWFGPAPPPPHPSAQILSPLYSLDASIAKLKKGSLIFIGVINVPSHSLHNY